MLDPKEPIFLNQENHSIYKKECFISTNGEEMSVSEKHELRAKCREKLRIYVYNFRYQHSMDDSQIRAFVSFYETYYVRQDYTVGSVYVGNDLAKIKMIAAFLSYVETRHKEICPTNQTKNNRK
ncbi:MAG: hypothetical protein IJS20_00065 [Bacteroidales bacterium]|nr:hypothetical protein [Bacteroidales bacterium]